MLLPGDQVVARAGEGAVLGGVQPVLGEVHVGLAADDEVVLLGQPGHVVPVALADGDLADLTIKLNVITVDADHS